MMSLRPKGTPASGPLAGFLSKARAAASARAGSRLVQAATSPSRAAMRSRQARMTASQVVQPARMAATISLAVHAFNGFEAADFMHTPSVEPHPAEQTGLHGRPHSDCT